MKFLAPLFLLLLSTGLLHAQSVILLEQDSVTQVLEDVDISNEHGFSRRNAPPNFRCKKHHQKRGVFEIAKGTQIYNRSVPSITAAGPFSFSTRP